MAYRTPAQIQDFLDDISHRLDGPNQYLGTEPNAYLKDWDSASVRWLIAASWAYEAAAGNSSIPAVYKSINIGREDFLCDRFYLPATPRDLRMLESNGIPIFGIESKHQAMDFDVIGTSISYPILVMSFVKMLKMSDIPVRWQDRANAPEKYPMVMIGGLMYGAPEVLAPIVDCVFCGEVEDEPGNPGIAVVTERIEQYKRSGLWSTDRVGAYKLLAREFSFLYFPRFVDVSYAYESRTHVGISEPSKQVVGYHSNLEGMRLPITKRIVKDMDKTVPLDNPPLLFTDPGMGSGDVEAARGCPAWCSFCALSWRQKPYRQRGVQSLTEYSKAVKINTGATGITPFSPDFPMYAQKKQLIKSLLENVSDEVESGAMRVDDFIADSDFITLQVQGGLTEATLGVEGNSQRMRDLVGKGTADEDVIEAFTRGVKAGLRKFKFFMITNLPGEDEGDIFRILNLAKKLVEIRESMGRPNVRIQFSWTPLFIEGNTPFQWFATSVANRIIGDVWEEMREINVEFKLGTKGEENKATFAQLCQRASREVGESIVDAMIAIDQACWGGVPRTTPTKLGMKDELNKALLAHGFTNSFDDVFDERFKNDMFGWEFINTGVSPELLWVTYQQMVEFIQYTDSHTYDDNFTGDNTYHGSEWVERCDSACQGRSCGVCDAKDFSKRKQYITESRSESRIEMTDVQPVDETSLAIKVRARLDKPLKYRQVMNDHWRFNVRRAAYKAFQALGWTDVTMTKRSIRFVSDDIKYREWSHGTDYVEFGLTRRISKERVAQLIEAMNEQLAAWMQITKWTLHPPTIPAMRSDADLTYWSIDLDYQLDVALAAIEKFKAADYVKLTLHADPVNYAVTRIEVNAKDNVDDLWLANVGGRLVLRVLMRGKPSPYELLSSLFGRSALEAAKRPAERVDSFLDIDTKQQDFLRPACETCGDTVPTNILDEAFNDRFCPLHLDEAEGKLINSLEYA